VTAAGDRFADLLGEDSAFDLRRRHLTVAEPGLARPVSSLTGGSSATRPMTERLDAAFDVLNDAAVNGR
jgi:hypothetical protein